ncbi:MAG: HIT family protein [Gemmatimonas sp.]
MSAPCLLNRRAALLAFAIVLSACRSSAPSPSVTPAPATAGDNSGLYGTYDNNNPFAKILRGELPVSKVYEDKYVLAFMPLRMITPGHVLIISKTSRARNLLDMKSADLARIMDVARRVAEAETRALGVQGFQILQNNGAVGTQSVFHLHVHVLPRYPGKELLPAAGPSDDRKVLDEMAAKIKAELR